MLCTIHNTGPETMTRLKVILVFGLLLVGLPLSLALSETKDVYRIGVILPLTGDAATMGNYLKNGIDLAYKSLAPDEQKHIQLFYEDSQLQANRAVSAYQKLRSVNRVNAIMLLGSGDGNAVAPLSEKEKVILISIGASDHNVSKGRKYAFIHWIIPEREVAAAISEMQSRGYKRWAYITQEQQGMIAVEEAFRNEMKRRGIENLMLVDERYLPDTKDFKTFIAKAQSHRCDVAVVCLWPGAVGAFAKQAKQMQFKADLVGIETFEDSSAVENSEGALEGQWFISSDDGIPEFISNYKAAYKEQPGWGSHMAYDSLKLLAEGVKSFGIDNDKISNFLQTLKDYKGACGTYSATGDQCFTLPVAIKIINGKDFKKLKGGL